MSMRTAELPTTSTTRVNTEATEDTGVATMEATVDIPTTDGEATEDMEDAGVAIMEATADGGELLTTTSWGSDGVLSAAAHSLYFDRSRHII